MKRFVLICIAFLAFGQGIWAGTKKDSTSTKKDVMTYRTFVYTDQSLADELVTILEDEETRGFLKDALVSIGNAAIGTATGYLSSLVDFGIQAIGQLITMDRRHKQEWLETATNECTFKSDVGTLYALNDFYTSGSDLGALDPTGIQFNGIGCLAMVGQDTSFYVSCHLNREKLNRLVDHSKFELTLDTIIIDPYHSHLPNTALPLSFSFAERKIFNFSLNIQILSSWMDFTPSMHNDEKLGEFSLQVTVDSSAVNKDGKFVYIRPTEGESAYEIKGESFIVPRSYMQFKDEHDALVEHFGTGQYSVNVIIEESCELTPEYQKSWRKDRKMRKNLIKQAGKKKSFDDVCRQVTNQTWDETLKSWVVTILKAPANYSIKALNDMMKIESKEK